MAKRSIIKRVLKSFGYVKNSSLKRATTPPFAGADTGRLFSSWTVSNQTLDAELKQTLKSLRARSRDMERNNDYAKKFIRMVKTNVVGSRGIKAQSKVLNAKGKPDDSARKKIETGFDDWGKKGICDVTGKLSFRDVQKMVISTIVRDGEILVRRHLGFENRFKYAIQLIEPDHLDEKHNEILPNGNRVKMGVEFDEYNRPVAYWIYKVHPGDYLFGASYGDKIRVPATDILHVYNPMRISQTRGVPWMHAALTRLNMLGDYELAELVAARLGAAKGGFYETETGDDEELPATDYSDGKPIQDVEPGHYEMLQPGVKFKPFDPQHPTTAFEAFEKAILRGIASGFDVSYNSLANDLEGVNYSSIRAGVLDERDVYKDIQAFLIEHFLDIIFDEWLFAALSSGAVDLPFDMFNKYRPVKWQPRGWQWVDPVKDINAKEKAISLGVETPQSAAAETGRDYEENLIEIREAELLKKKYLGEFKNEEKAPVPQQ